MKHHVFAVERGGQKTRETPVTANDLPSKPLCHCTKGYRFDGRLDGPDLSCLGHTGAMFQPDIECRQSRRRVPQRIERHHAGRQLEPIGNLGFTLL